MGGEHEHAPTGMRPQESAGWEVRTPHPLAPEMCSAALPGTSELWMQTHHLANGPAEDNRQDAPWAQPMGSRRPPASAHMMGAACLPFRTFSSNGDPQLGGGAICLDDI